MRCRLWRNMWVGGGALMRCSLFRHVWMFRFFLGGEGWLRKNT